MFARRISPSGGCQPVTRRAIRVNAEKASSSSDGLDRRAVLASLLAVPLTLTSVERARAQNASFYNFSAPYDGEEVSLSKYKGQVVMVFNTASQ